MMRCTSACTVGRDSVPRGFDWTSALSCSSLAFLLPSKATRLITGFSTTVTTSRPPACRSAHPGTDRWREGLEALVDSCSAVSAARAGLEIRADGLGFDPPVAAHLNGIGGLRGRNARGHHARDPSTDRDTRRGRCNKPPVPVKPAHQVPCATRPFDPRDRPRSGIDRLRDRFCQLCIAFYRTANETSPPSFPFPSLSCTSATITRWPSAECH